MRSPGSEDTRRRHSGAALKSSQKSASTGASTVSHMRRLYSSWAWCVWGGGIRVRVWECLWM